MSLQWAIQVPLDDDTPLYMAWGYGDSALAAIDSALADLARQERQIEQVTKIIADRRGELGAMRAGLLNEQRRPSHDR